MNNRIPSVPLQQRVWTGLRYAESWEMFIDQLFDLVPFKDLKKAFHEDMLKRPHKMNAFKRPVGMNEFSFWEHFKVNFGGFYRWYNTTTYNRNEGFLKKSDMIDFFFSIIKTKAQLKTFIEEQYERDEGILHLRNIPQSLQKVIARKKAAEINMLNKKGIPKDVQRIIMSKSNGNVSSQFSRGLLRKFNFKKTNFGRKKWTRNQNGRLNRTPSWMIEEHRRIPYINRYVSP